MSETRRELMCDTCGRGGGDHAVFNLGHPFYNSEALVPVWPVPLSEAAGDKVTVPMTERHVAAIGLTAGMFPELSVTAPLLREIEANIRSQVESGMTGRYNPETHRIVNVEDLQRLMFEMEESEVALPADAAHVWKQLVAWLSLSPSPETPEPK